jgi:phospholipase/carboxylesterase
MNEIVKRRVGGLEILERKGDPSRGTIIFLHGFGADAFDLEPLSQCYEGPTWIFPQGPLEIPFSSHYSGRAWFPIDMLLLNRAIAENRLEDIFQAFPPNINAARDCIENLLADLNIPMDQIILGGFSQGAILAIETVLSSPLKWGGLVIFSGTLIHETSWKRLAPQHANTPFFQSHGTHDPLLPLPFAQALERLLQECGLKGKLHTFQGGHDIPHIIVKQLSTFLHQIFKDKSH